MFSSTLNPQSYNHSVVGSRTILTHGGENMNSIASLESKQRKTPYFTAVNTFSNTMKSGIFVSPYEPKTMLSKNSSIHDADKTPLYQSDAETPGDGGPSENTTAGGDANEKAGPGGEKPLVSY